MPARKTSSLVETSPLTETAMFHTRTVRILASLVGAIILGVLIGSLGMTEPTRETVKPLQGPLQADPQEATTRSWRDILGPKVLTVGLQNEDMLFNPSYTRVSPQGNLFVLDRGDQRIKKYSGQDGTLLQEFGNGRGEGPGEFQMITDMMVTPSERVLVCDSENGRITVFGPSGQIEHEITPPTPPYRMAFVADPEQRLIVLPLYPVDELFDVYDLDGNLHHEFGLFIEDQTRNSLILDGKLHGHGDGFVYTPLRIGWLASFTADGTAQYFRETIETVPIPEVVRSGDMAYVDRDAPTLAYTVNPAGDEVLVTSSIDSSGHSIRVLDVYSHADGDYLYSSKIPSRARSVHADEDRIYAVIDTTVSVWTRRSP